MIAVWLYLAICAGMIGAAGVELTRSGDAIAAKTGLSRSWIGLVLLATVTSLPELVSGASAVTVAAVPNIAVGNVFGACVFNLILLVVLDFLHREESVYRRAAQGHILSAGFGVVLIGFAGLNLLLRDNGFDIAIGHIGAYTPVIVIMYLVAVRAVFTYERRTQAERAEAIEERHPELTLRSAMIRFAAAAAVVTAAGVWLPFVAADLATAMGWHRTFVGTIFVAAITTLPEAVVTIAAVRFGALDMAVANLLGSNLFDMLVLAVDDLLFVDGPILRHVASAHAVSAMSAVIMTGLVVIGILYRPAARLFRTLGWVSLGLFLVYVLNAYVLYLHGE